MKSTSLTFTNYFYKMNKKQASNTFSLQNIDIHLPKIITQQWDHKTQVFLLPKVQQNIYFVTFEYTLSEDLLRTGNHNLWIHHVLKDIIGQQTKNENKKSLQNFFEQRGATFQTGTTSQSLFIRLSCLAAYWQDCLAKIQEIIYQATLDLKTWKRIQKKLILQVSDRLFDSQTASSDQLKNKLLGPNTFISAQPSVNNIESLNPCNLQAAYHIIVNQAPLSIFVGGAWTDGDLYILKNTFNREKSAYLHITENKWNIPAQEIKPPRYNGSQYSLHWGIKTVAANDLQFPTALMAAKVLGGYFGSRLMQILREEKGLTYGVYAYVLPFKKFSLFEIATDVSQDQLELTQEIIHDTLQDLSHNLIPEKEWATVKNHLIGDLLSSLDGPIALMNRVRSLSARGMNAEDFKKQSLLIQQMEAQEVQAFFQNHLNPSLFEKVWIG